MTTSTISFDDLCRIIAVSAGVDDGVQLTDDKIDTPLCELGYDSLALLETVSRLEREYGITLDESAASADVTARELLACVNEAAGR
jgi:act minimal PKS acyl carrier protein